MDRIDDGADENRRLRRTMRDLVALSTSPAIWTGLGPEGIGRSLADALLGIMSASALSFPKYRILPEIFLAIAR